MNRNLLFILALLLTSFALSAQETPISMVQGSGTTSPLSGQTVTVTGIVTAIKSNGFFVQSSDELADSDPASSEALFIFTSSAPAVAKQQRVRVRGRVTEFSPDDPLTAPLTELASNPTIEIIASNAPLPAALVIDPAPDGGFDQLERFEGMRVTLRNVIATDATEASRDERNGIATSRGVFYVAPAPLPRPRTEEGIDIRLTIPSPAPCCIARFDGNPERLRVDSDGQAGVPPADVAVGTMIAEISGVLDYGSHDYTILPDTQIASNTFAPTPLPPSEEGHVRIATFNMLRLYDDRDEPGIGDTVVSAAAYQQRLRKFSRAIVELLAGPDLIGVQEVENLAVLQALAQRVREVSGGTIDYEAFSIGGNDPSGLNVGILARRGTVALSEVAQSGKEATFTDPRDGSTDTLFDRPPLLARVASGPLTFTFIVNHLRSLNDIETNPFVRAKRAGQAEFLARLVDARQKAGELVVLVGDLNARDENDGWVDVIGTIAGRPAPPAEVMLAAADLVEPDLVRLPTTNPDDDFTFVHEGNTESLDHLIVSGALLPHVRNVRVAHINTPFPEIESVSELAVRSSDHDVPLLTLSLTRSDRRRPVKR